VFALTVVLVYFLATLPILLRHHVDPSAFIIAGDRFVDPAQLPSPIIVQPNSAGYDGEFFYRLALSPFHLQPTGFGVRLDHPGYRAQRIVYPLLAWAASFGYPAAVPVALYLVNLLSLAAIAIIVTHLTARLRLPVATPLAILLWPGFLVALTHDTSEIVAAALLLGALDAYLAQRQRSYGVLGALAILARQTTLPVLAGVLCFEAIQAVWTGDVASRWRRVLICGLVPVPFLVWLAMLHLVWGYSPREGTRLVGWPLLGAATMLRDTLTGANHLVQANRPAMDLAVRAYVLESAGWILGFCAIVAARLPAVLRMGDTRALAAGWLPQLVLMSMMTAQGGWVDRSGYFRTFTECYVVGCLVLAAQPMPRRLTRLMVAFGALAFLGAWVLTISKK
jgi:hypothetical protein